MSNDKGYSLIELMIAVAIFGIIMTGIYQTYHSQQNSYLKEEQIADMQQNLRAGVYFLTRDIKMAGYDPSEDADATITKAEIAELTFQIDEDGSGLIGDGPSETVEFALTKDNNTDGIADSFPCNLGRQYNGAGGFQPVCENVQALEFCYVLDDGTVLTSVSDVEKIARIRSILISMLVRSKNRVKGYKNTVVYTQASNNPNLTAFLVTRPAIWGPFNDSYKRRLTVLRVRCRNMGLVSAP